MNRTLVIFLSLVILIGIGIGSSTAQVVNTTANGSNDPILSPSLNQTQDQAEAQAQTSNSTNRNHLNNSNDNTAASGSSADNHVNIVNENTFNPVLLLSSVNEIGDIGVFSANENIQAQGPGRFLFGEGALEFAAPGNVPMVMTTVPKKAAVSPSAGVGMLPTGLNVTSLLMGILGVLGGLLASRYSS